MLRKLFVLAFALASVAGVASCGTTDESSLGSSSAASSAFHAFPFGADGGISARGHTLLVQGGDVTFIAFLDGDRHCRPGDGDAGCPEPERFSGSVVIRGARLSVLHGGPDGDGGVAGTPGGDDGGVGADGGAPLPHNAQVFARSVHLSFTTGDGDGGVVGGPGGDGGASGNVGSAELQGGSMFALLGRTTDGDGDAGTPAGGGGDGGVDADGGSTGPHVLRHLHRVIIQSATLHFRTHRGHGDADAGVP